MKQTKARHFSEIAWTYAPSGLKAQAPISSNAPASAGEPFIQYQRLIDSFTDYAIFALFVDGRIATWNAGAQETFGYTAQEVIGKSYSLLFTEDDVAAGRPEAELLASQQCGKSATDGWHRRKNGNTFWSTDTLQQLRDTSGTVTGFTKIVRDSNEQHLAWEQLRESEERLRLLVEGVTDYAIFSIDTAGRILLWNSGAEHLFGHHGSEVIGKHFSLLYTAEAIACGVPDAEIATAARVGRAFDEGWHVRQGGDTFYASGYTMRLQPDATGNPRGFVKIAHDITARRKSDETIRRQALYDELTRLPNRLSFIASLRQSIAKSKEWPKSRFAIILLDLDQFKAVNDRFGHALADGLLVHVARTLEGCVRPGDTIARFGGDEFTIMLSDICETTDVLQVAERIQAAFHHPLHLGGFKVYATVSMGLAVGSSAYDQPEQILRDADMAMYEAKTRGRSQHVLFDSAMRARAAALLCLQADLRGALERQEFFLEYQPIVTLGDCRVIGFEALVRWNHPDRGLLLPAEFIAEAERIGLIIQIDRWVLREACRQIRAWQVQYDDATLTVSVNLSSKQFSHEDLVAEIRSVLTSSDLTARSLKVEITETTLMEQCESTAKTVAQVSDLGVDVYIDDFGTGYSSLSYLAQYPLNLLKVDRSFVTHIPSNPRSIEIARTIVTLAHNLGLAALAEGIETEEQLIQLRALGCQMGQGYWLSPPLTPDVAQTLIGHCLPRGTETPLAPPRDNSIDGSSGHLPCSA